jgi:hypothetical protein
VFGMMCVVITSSVQAVDNFETPEQGPRGLSKGLTAAEK